MADCLFFGFFTILIWEQITIVFSVAGYDLHFQNAWTTSECCGKVIVAFCVKSEEIDKNAKSNG